MTTRAFLFLVSVTIVFVGLAAYARYVANRKKRVVKFAAAERLRGKPMRLLSWDSDNAFLNLRPSEIAVPIEYSTADQGFVVGVQLGKTKVYLVLDSGSQYVATATRECIDAGLCTSAKDGGYVPGDGSETHEHDRVDYGSLSIESRWMNDAIEFRGSSDPCKKSDALVKMSSNVWIAAAKRMKGTDSNILGLMMPHAGSKKPCFLQSFCEANGCPRAWWIQTKGNSGTLGFGRAPWACLGKSPVTIGLSNAQYLGGFIVDVQGVYVRKSADGQWYRAESPVRYALLDTGCFHSYFPKSASARLQTAGFPCDAPTGDGVSEVSLWIGGAMEPLVLRYTRDHQGFRSDGDIDQILGRDDMMLLGITHMQNSIWEFDADRNTVKFAV